MRRLGALVLDPFLVSDGEAHHTSPGPDDTRDVCASFQRAVVDVLVAKTIAAARVARRGWVTVSGGVSCNGELRAQMSLGCERAGLELRFAAPELCTDNAVMIAFAAMLRLERGETTPLTTEINPNLALA